MSGQYTQIIESISRANEDISNVTRYSYFGSFRSDVSNVGGNVAFLTPTGKLTDIGSWYLGGGKTGNIPSSAPSSGVHPLYASLFVTVMALWSAL